ncbi:EAL domain-containing protein [Herbaspirillum lusitanum]|uniref:EAL domain-containing protein n=1 Tax=Herbaspirillum lusitanum TaxID=213312 RepID=UPI00031D55AD|nr:EAL domain-containing protein [Herbaspirillum lusitanum]
MKYQALEKYLARLNGPDGSGGQESKVWLDAEGRAQGKYFNTTLTSAFQPIRVFGSAGTPDAATPDATIVAHEGFARSYSEDDSGLHLWRLLDQAASDDESVELDRLCRMLHSINFYRQVDYDVSLHLSVHARLLAAVDSNHGIAFRRILNLLELPHDKIVLQMPVVTQNQGWLLNYVLDNYRRNGFRLGISAADARDALALLEKVKPDMIKVDARELTDEEGTEKLLRQAAAHGIRVVFKRVENPVVFARLQDFGGKLGTPVYAQGYLWDTPKSILALPLPDSESKVA